MSQDSARYQKARDAVSSLYYAIDKWEECGLTSAERDMFKAVRDRCLRIVAEDEDLDAMIAADYDHMIQFGL